MPPVITRSNESPDTIAVGFAPARGGAPIAIGTGFTADQFRHDDYPAGAMSPFVLVDHFEMWEPTFAVHPHAGMSAVTLTFADTQGSMTSRDTVGHVARIEPGDLHWTLAGRGIQHTQLPTDAGSRIHALQIFVNLPARAKWIAPDSFLVSARAMPRVQNAGATVRVVVGEFGGQRSAAPVPEPVLMLDVSMDGQGGNFELPLPGRWNAWILVLSGELTLGTSTVLKARQATATLASDESRALAMKSRHAAHFVVLAGPRIDEPVIQQGPFVFESDASMARAIADFQAGRFGTVPTDAV